MKQKTKVYLGNIREGIVSGFPIVIGYIPIAMAFGMLARTTGVTLIEAFLFSALVFAGASQFMALNLLALGVGVGQIIVATLLMNLRHLLMSGSLAAKLKDSLKGLIPLLAFGVTDETFSVITLNKDEVEISYAIPLQLVSYLSWVSGTVVGYLIGEVIPLTLRNSMGVALYAMFVAILIPAMKKSKTATLLALGAAGVNVLLTTTNLLPSGWNLIATILIVSMTGVYIFPEEGEAG